MKKILVLVIAMVMSGFCKAQIPWGKLIEIAGGLISTGSTVHSMLKSPNAQYLDKGKELCELNEYEKAIDCFIKINKDDYDAIRVEAYYYQGLCYMGLEENDKALKIFDIIINFKTSFFTQDENLIEKIKKKAKRNKKFLEQEKQRIAMDKKLQKEAITLAKNINTANCKYFIAGMNYFMEDNFENAFISLDKVSNDDYVVVRVMAHYYKGQCRFKQRQLYNATINFRRALNIQIPDDVLCPFQIKEYQKKAQQMIDKMN